MELHEPGCIAVDMRLMKRIVAAPIGWRPACKTLVLKEAPT